MLIRLATTTFMKRKKNFSVAFITLGLGQCLFFLQWGFYLGFLEKTTVIPDTFPTADVWIMSASTQVLDFARPVHDSLYERAVSRSGIKHSQRLVMGYAKWRIPSSGMRENIVILGCENGAMPKRFGITGHGYEDSLSSDGHVLINRKDAPKLGVALGNKNSAEINSKRVHVAGYVEDKSLFSTASLVITGLETAKSLLSFPQVASHFRSH